MERERLSVKGKLCSAESGVTPARTHCRSRRSGKRLGTSAILLTAGLTTHAMAGNAIWDGGATPAGEWSNAANWNPNAAPSPNDVLQFSGVVGLSNTNDFAAGTQFNGINFDATSGGFTLGGNSLNLAGNISN